MTATDVHPLAGLGFTNGAGGYDYVSYPSAVNARWVLPRDPALRRASMRLYQPQSFRGSVLKSLIARGWLRGGRSALDRERLADLQSEIGKGLVGGDVRLAFFTGTPGAYRKVVAQVMDAHGAVLAYAKIASDPLAQQAVGSEHARLFAFAAFESLRGCVPKVLRFFTWQGRTVLLLSAGPPNPGPRRFGTLHRDFLQRLHAATMERVRFSQSRMWQRMAALVAELETELPIVWSRRYERALTTLAAILGPLELPISTAHRDFTPWNTRVGPNGLFVFDWEASEPAVPFYDAFHFHCIPSALWERTRGAAEAVPSDVVDRIWPEAKPYLKALFLAYLTDMSLFYSEARVRAPQAGEARVWDWLGTQIDHCLASPTLVSAK